MKRILIALFIGLLGSAMTCSQRLGAGDGADQRHRARSEWRGVAGRGSHRNANRTPVSAEATITNETGSYILPNLAVGPYRLEAALPGFRTFVQTGIVLQVNSNPVINPVLEVGQVTEQVEVQANAALVETRSTAVGQVIENERILELPLNGRQVTDLITLSGAAVQTGDHRGNQSMPGGVYISIAGGRVFRSVVFPGRGHAQQSV